MFTHESDSVIHVIYPAFPNTPFHGEWTDEGLALAGPDGSLTHYEFIPTRYAPIHPVVPLAPAPC